MRSKSLRKDIIVFDCVVKEEAANAKRIVLRLIRYLGGNIAQALIVVEKERALRCPRLRHIVGFRDRTFSPSLSLRRRQPGEFDKLV